MKGCFCLTPEKALPTEDNTTTTTTSSPVAVSHTLLQVGRSAFLTMQRTPDSRQPSDAGRQQGLSALNNRLQQPLKTHSVEAALSEVNSGMLCKDLNELLGLASKTNTVIGFRPVSWAAKFYIEAGYPSKNFHIKTKSAKWGPQIGLLCPTTTETIDEAYAKRGNLFLTASRVNELLTKGCIRLESVKQNAENTNTRFDAAESFIFYANEPASEKASSSTGESPKVATTHQYQAVKRENTSGQNSSNALQDVLWDIKKFDPESNTANEYVQVLFCPIKNLPITADYDLLTYARPSAHQTDNNNQPLMAVWDFNSFIQTRKLLSANAKRNLSQSNTSITASTDPVKISHSEGDNLQPRTEDPHRGNVSPFTDQLIDSINLTLARGEGLDMVHHNIEAHNPFPNEDSCYPAIFCLPGEQPQTCSSDASMRLYKLNEPLGNLNENVGRWTGDRVVLIKTIGEMTNFRKVIEDHGYYMEVSPLFIGGGMASEPPKLRSSHSGMF